MKLLVTGGAGFIGSNFIHYWLDQHPSDQIVNLDKLTYAGNLENLADLSNDNRYTFEKGDICDSKLVFKLVKNVDIIVHFAAESHVDRSINKPHDFIQTNVNGTFVLLEAAKYYNKRLHHVSTDEVFGSLEINSTKKFTEKTPYDPSSPYSASKAASDHLVRAYHRTYSLPVTISNTSNNFGPYMFPEKFIPLAITNAIEDKKIPIYGKGQQIRDWLYVLDHCRGIDLIINQAEIGQTYLIGGMTSDITNIEVANMIVKLLHKDANLIEFVQDRPGHDERYSIDWSKAKNQLGYKPQHNFKKYLSSTIDWYLQNQSWWKRVKSGDYQKYYQQQYKKTDEDNNQQSN